MPRSTVLAGVLGALVIAGCAAGPTAPEPSAPNLAAAGKDEPLTTGSRLKRNSTDRMVKGVNQATFKADNRIQSMGDEIGARSN